MDTFRRMAGLLFVLFLAQSALAVRRRLASVMDTRGFATPNYTIYHRQDDLLRKVVDIVKANPGYMKLETFSEKDGAYDAEVKVVTVEPGGFSNRQHEKVRMLMDFGEHGRELISSELGLLLLQTLAAREGPMRVFPGEVDRGRELQRLLEGTIIKILPMENEGGRRLVEAGRLCERKNGRGVDPNRNWAVDWGTKEPDYDPNEEYPGTAPFSEPETKILRRLTEEFRPHVWLNIHSGMEAMLAPWDHVAEIALEAQPSVEILQRIFLDIMKNTTCVVGSGGKTVGYLAHGTATDYMFKELRVPLAFTWEIYGDFKAHFDDCFRMFNPLHEAGVKETLERWLRAIMRLVELMPGHPALKDSKAWAAQAAAGTGAAAAKAGGVEGESVNPQGGGGDGSGSGSSGDGQGNALGGGTGAGPALITGAGATTSSTSSTKGGKQDSSSDSKSNTSTITTASSSTGASGQQSSQAAAAGPGGAIGSSGGASGGNSSGSSSINSGSGGDAAEGEQPRIAVVASVRGWAGSWSAELFSGLLAVAGLVVVGGLAYRCLARPSGELPSARVPGWRYQRV